MLLIIVEICLEIIIFVKFFVDNLWLDILFWSIIFATIIDALIRTLMYAKYTFRCKYCGGSFSLKRRRLLNRLGPWKKPIRIKYGKEVEPRIYSRSYIVCPTCGSYECVLWMDE